VFTGDEFGDGTAHIREVLARQNIRGSFFFTGRFYRNPDFAEDIRGPKADGHYLGAHSDQHLLYCSWENRDSLLVTRDELVKDILDNYAEMERFGVKTDDAPIFMPPYEWYNDQISMWTSELGLTLINYSLGTRSHADYTTPELDHYVSSGAIMQSIISHEARDPHGLNGFILLSHVGSAPERPDKFYLRLEELIDVLKERGYAFQRIDELLTGLGR
jgi:peptidoglycan/xylan/chitin deacetylase (PgdA/CDA1 family)